MNAKTSIRRRKNVPAWGARAKNGRGIFITGTDTGVGKTVAVRVMGLLLIEAGVDVGVMKPVQCGGTDARDLQEALNLADAFEDINPYFAKEAVSPHLAFARQKKRIDPALIQAKYRQLQAAHEVVLIEGAGGLLVPLARDYLVSDLIRELDLEVVIVSRLGLGTINHTLLTVRQARGAGLNVRGVIFNQGQNARRGLPEKTNPGIIKALGEVEILGQIPFLKDLSRERVLRECRDKVRVARLMKGPARNSVKRQHQELVDWDKKYVWHPFTQMRDWLNEKPLIIDRGRGSYLIDTEGNRYLDGVSSLWVNVHGHGQPQMDRALKAQVDRLSHSTFLGLSNVPAVKLAKKLIEIVPRGLAKVFYSDNGSTAVEIALKIAYQYWQNIGRVDKTRIVHLANSYHGDTLGGVSVGGIELFHKVYRLLTFPALRLDFPDCYRAPEGKEYPAYAFECLDRLEGLFQDKARSIAALIVEPIVQGAAGMIMWPDGVLKRMRALCDQYDVLLIADEVATGFGRTGKMFACEHEGVTPDILCLAKGLTGGYLPLAATVTTRKIFDGFCFPYEEQKTFFHGHTYTGNPLACAAALASLEVFQKRDVLKRLQPKIRFLRQQLKAFAGLSHVGDVRQRGFMVGIELVQDRDTKQPFAWQRKMGVRVCQAARARGVILRPLGNVIVLMPPLSMTVAELKTLLDVTYLSIRDVTENEPRAVSSAPVQRPIQVKEGKRRG